MKHIQGLPRQLNNGLHAATGIEKTADSGRPLGIYGKIASGSVKNANSEGKTPQKETAKKRRYRLQSVARDLLPGESVADCMRLTVPIDPQTPGAGVYEHVEVNRNPETGRCTTHNLVLCDRVWICPCCAARISEQRKQELEAVYYYSGKGFLFATYTLRHKRPDSLKNVLNGLSAALRGMKSGRWWQDLKREFDLLGEIKSLEITYGENGWHPHAHVLMVFDREITPHLVGVLEAQLKAKWRDVLHRSGLDATHEHGVQVTGASSEIAAYITKYGHLPAGEDDVWAAPEELVKSQQKMARTGGRTIWQILGDYDRDGDPHDAALFLEYAAATKGKAQLHWSRGLKELLNLDDLLAQHLEPEPETEFLIGVSRHEWIALYWSRRRGEFLELCEENELAAAIALISQCVERYNHAKGRASPWSWPVDI